MRKRRSDHHPNAVAGSGTNRFTAPNTAHL